MVVDKDVCERAEGEAEDEEAEEERRDTESKQEPHTKMWEKA
jgi:hypothetical protein